MRWLITSAGSTQLEIRSAAADAIHTRLDMYRKHRGRVPDHEQATVEIYAEATYLKFQTAHAHFASAVGTFAEWQHFRASQREALMLLEAWTPGAQSEVAGALLLRSAWTGDIVIDFVGTNFGATKYASPPLTHVGVMLVCAAMDVGMRSGAALGWAETAAHSAGWWNRLLEFQHHFVKVHPLPEAYAKVLEMLEANNVQLSLQTA